MARLVEGHDGRVQVSWHGWQRPEEGQAAVVREHAGQRRTAYQPRSFDTMCCVDSNGQARDQAQNQQALAKDALASSGPITARTEDPQVLGYMLSPNPSARTCRLPNIELELQVQQLPVDTYMVQIRYRQRRRLQPQGLPFILTKLMAAR